MHRRDVLMGTLAAPALWPAVAAAGPDPAAPWLLRWSTRRVHRWSRDRSVSSPRHPTVGWEDTAAVMLFAAELDRAGDAVQADPRVQRMVGDLAPEAALRAALLVGALEAADLDPAGQLASDPSVRAEVRRAAAVVGVSADAEAREALTDALNGGVAGLVASFDGLARRCGLGRVPAGLTPVSLNGRAERKGRRRMRRLGILLFFVGLILVVLSFGYAPMLIGGLVAGVVGLGLFVWSFLAIVVGASPPPA